MNLRTQATWLLVGLAWTAGGLSTQPALATPSTVERIHQLLLRYHTQRHFHGAVLVAEDGEVIYQEAFGLADIEEGRPNTLATRFGLASVSKQFTAMIILQLVEEGRLDLDRPVTAYLPGYPAATGDRLTIHHLLTHTSGIRQDDPLQGTRQALRRRKHSRRRLLAYFQSDSLLFEPGEGFQYSNFNYNLLATIAEAVTGARYEDLLQQRIFDPLGMTGTCVGASADSAALIATGYDYAFLRQPRRVAFTHESVALGAGDLYSTVGDLYLWDQALYSDTLLSAPYRELLFTPHTEVGYAYGWQVRRYPTGVARDSVTAVYHDGGSEGVQCCVYRIPEDRTCFVVLSNHREPWIHIRLCRPKEEMAPALIKTLYGGECPLPRSSAAYQVALAAEAVGADVIEVEYEKYRHSAPDDFLCNGEEFYTVGLSYMWRSEHPKALEFLRIAVDDLGIDHLGYAWQCYAVYGEAAVLCKQPEEAMPILERSLALKPGNQPATYWLQMARASE